MRRELLVPKLGLTMTEGTLIEWMISPGDRFDADQGLYVIESDKAANEVSAEGSGVLLEVTAELGMPLSVGSVIGYWDDDPQAATNHAVRAEPSAHAAAASASSPDSNAANAAPSAQTSRPPAAMNGQSGQSGQSGARGISTPLARRLARERGIDLTNLAGSGPRGRIRARDVELAPANSPASAPDVPLPATASRAAQVAQAATVRAATSIEKTIARRLVTSKQTIPHFYLSVEAEISAVQRLRSQLNDAQSNRRFTVNHFVVAAVGRALALVPEANRVWDDSGITSFAATDVGVAVHTERGLLVPVLRDVGRQALGEVARHASEAIGRAQAGQLNAAEMAGGAITVSNAGMHDVTLMTSIINPGQSMILGVGSVRQVFRPDAHGQPALKNEVGLVLSVDHRVLDGVTALKFLRQVVAAIERPASLLVT
ncbi:e3 binding domain protein [Paraburkholderia xenovorans LB400]|uniref:Dihydrolipoamide acetyltransferase component of pyruvate dehydrogenase complex n=1 Tax=Paraburkholderia xenovorans (strain LB400) TaxID=266265 RepID=Q13GQ6_PARXL|nr:dihydrolipoamide acetyltransferase family protein [Paraburkholderia xenovorans]ABE36733.1 dihydrolipoamide acyltransferase (E2) component of 2-oxoacid dehydrogenase complexes [Paraburkholderia xenovorans LB400]AIP34537.1 e3 binding domain protein [Paraburkholderia xenovorans LB400]